MTSPASEALVGLEARRRYLRPLQLAIALSVAAELGILLIFGMLLSPGGSLLHKTLWTLVFCGLGMGSAVGAFVDLLVVDRLRGLPAVLACAGISSAILGVACNLLCWRLDLHFHYFGGASNPALFLGGGVVLAALGGAAAGALLFTASGERWLDRAGI